MTAAPEEQIRGEGTNMEENRNLEGKGPLGSFSDDQKL